MPSKYDPETRAKAVRLVLEHRGDYPSEWAAITAVSKRLGMTAETLRSWIRQHQVDDGDRDGVSDMGPILSSGQGEAAATTVVAAAASLAG